MSEKSNADLMEGFRERREKLHQRDILPIFMGAILTHENNLVSNQNRFVQLFTELQSGIISYPESMTEKINHVEIYTRTIQPESPQIYSMFSHLGLGLGVEWTWEEYGGLIIGYRYKLDENAKFEFLDEWGDNYEALDFFEKCGDFLSLED